MTDKNLTRLNPFFIRSRFKRLVARRIAPR